jgi:hypothetical protein
MMDRMGWLVVERTEDGPTVLKECETYEEAERVKAALIAENVAYEDVLEILREGADEPSDASEPLPN